MSKRSYTVAVPITGAIFVDVEAESEEQAIELAMESDDLLRDNIEEWECHRHVVQGNVFYGHYRHVEVVSDNGPVDGEEEQE